MYKIIGIDQKVYGPVSLDQLRQWHAEGRVNGATLLQVEGSNEWKPLGAIPEFGIPPPVSMPPASTRERRNGMAVAGLVFGILSNLCFSAYVFPVLGLIFSAVALSRHDEHPQSGGKNMAVAGLILSAIGLIWRGAGPFFFFHRHWHRW